ncbi:hypothetical protein E4O05_10055 [Treponema sp. OMZ 787]|uniref:hypothetical protein n=1 Tax=Treponema sp. OMZ 787 TaxID=2563669 RepID=UPI0020A4528F|nr:hypothetical protein [Treponema sp. OMZ 787]UTC61863.1 hypothetical protein E4O05_10055 [Treponema sp. OMZ 787]
MPQISLYVKESHFEKIEKAAKSANKSISSWVLEKILPQIEPSYSKEFIDLFGSIDDKTFKRPEQLKWEEDSLREFL